MKKITLFSISDSLGGAEQVLFKIAKFYSEHTKCRVKVFFIKPQTNIHWQEHLNINVEIIYLNNNIFLLFKHLKKQAYQKVFSTHLIINAFLGFTRTIRILKTDILICRESTQVFGRYIGNKLLKYKLAYWLGYRNIDLLICQTNQMKDILDKRLKYLSRRTKIEVIPNPFDFPSQSIVNEKVDVPENTIVSAGRLIPEKGFDILIRAFSNILKTNSELKLMILGEGVERDKLEKLIKSLDLGNNVTLIGHVTNVYPYFKRAKLCVVSSIKEGFPNVLLQMMSQNINVVSTLCAGGINHIQGLYTCDTGSSNDLAKQIEKCLQSDNTKNRPFFEAELKNRSIEKFVQKIESKIEN